MTLLLASTIKVSAILLVALLGAACLRTRSAAVRHWVLAVGVASAFIAPLVHVLPLAPTLHVAPPGPLARNLASVSEAPRPRAYIEPTARSVRPGAVTPEPENTARGPASAPSSSRPVAGALAGDGPIGRLAVGIWLTGAIAGAGILLAGMARLRWLRASSRRVDDGPWRLVCREAARSCGVGRCVDLLVGPSPELMATWGWRRPAVLLPESAAEWPAERVRIVLLHELAHVRRGDWVALMAAEALRCVWWFNPLAWMVSARLRRESERAADDLVLSHGVDATTCATHLVELARQVRKHRRTWLPAPAMARPSSLQRRIAAMLNPLTNRRPLTRVGRLCILAGLALASMLVGSLQVAARQGAGLTVTVVDQAGNPVPSADLQLRARGVPEGLQVSSDEDGRFEFTDLEPRVYDLAVSMPGFDRTRLRLYSASSMPWNRANRVLSEYEGFERLVRRLSLEPGAQVEEELVLQLGLMKETMTVPDAGEPPPMPGAGFSRLMEESRRRGTVAHAVGLRQQFPVYPASVRGSGFEGEVVLEGFVKTDGAVEVLKVLAPVDPATMTLLHPDLARSAVEAVGGWRYDPTRLGGVPVDTRIRIRVNFRP